MKFTGHERDLGITVCPISNPQCSLNADDVDYMHARYYRPGLGRFLSVDPMPGSLQMPQSWNKYSYVQGNPMSLVDPTGLYTSDCAMVVLSCVQAVAAIEAARQATLSSTRASAELKAAAESYGELGEASGVVVGFGAVGQGHGAETAQEPRFDIAADGSSFSVSIQATVTFAPGLSGAELQAAVAHEGAHLLHGNAWAASFDAAGNPDASLNLTLGQSDSLAYRMSAEVAGITQASFRFPGGTLRPNTRPGQLEKALAGIIGSLSPEYKSKKLIAGYP
jgi:RHS repeat-associated protein